MSAGYIEVSEVWKKFRYGEVHNRLRDFIPAVFARRGDRSTKGDDGLGFEEFWALQDVNFEVQAGEALGVIGPNGAGKSTILKLLTRIMGPTAGRCTVRGRVGALIDVAAGFHPDLTGRENVFLQGAIMGMRREEIGRKFDQIVEFSGIPWFIDTPVKRYSSGMQARLGFAIAAHLDPDVLIIDEVLAVGDASFQRKALDRVTALVHGGIPVVVVSHQLEAVAALCTKAVLLEKGLVIKAGSPNDCIAAYLQGVAEQRPVAVGEAATRIHELSTSATGVRSGEDLHIRLACSVRPDGWSASEALSLRVRSSQTAEILFETSTLRLGIELPVGGDFELDLDLTMNVAPGVYVIESFVWDRLMERESFGGPSRFTEVRGGDDFDGAVNLRPRAKLVMPATTT